MRRLGPRTLLAIVALLAAPRVGNAAQAAIAVIVNPSRHDVLDIPDLGRIYLGQRRFWDDGTPIVAFNLPSGTDLREQFSTRVLHEASAHLASYWNQRYFHGLFPPAVLSSPDAVKRYVATDAKAIGYVPAADVDPSVRVILVLE